MSGGSVPSNHATACGRYSRNPEIAKKIATPMSNRARIPANGPFNEVPV